MRKTASTTPRDEGAGLLGLSRAAILGLTFRELDLAVAEHVLGWRWHRFGPERNVATYYFWPGGVFPFTDGSGNPHPLVAEAAPPPGTPDARKKAGNLPPYSGHDFACRQMEEEIQRRGIGGKFAEALHDLLDLSEQTQTYFDGVFACMTAPCDVRCRAALLAVIGTAVGETGGKPE